MQYNQHLTEGLRPLDLEDMVYPVFEIDAYQSKMGNDRDVCVLTFRVKDRDPARDLMEFVEKGFDFVLDSDVSSGENNRGEYFVFVELERTVKLAEHIQDITYGFKRLTGINTWEFKFHHSNTPIQLTRDSVINTVPMTAPAYDKMLQSVRTNEVRQFFNKTLMDDLSITDDIITIHKPYGQFIKLKMIKEGDEDNILENIDGSLALDNQAMGEIFWLTKVVGDYNINKTSDGFVFENNGKVMILHRLD